VDLAKYRELFLEESTDHLAEMSRALLELEKDAARSEAIDLLFRMAHSIKGMAASLEYRSIEELAHRLEDRMQLARAAGRVAGGPELGLLFRGVDGLEAMVAAVRETGEAPPPDRALLAVLAGSSAPPPEAGQKKA
jgi:two-component system chemotaxis sensor kinase CheA